MPAPRRPGRHPRALRGPRGHRLARALIVAAGVQALLGVLPLEARAQWVRVQARTSVWVELADDGATLRGFLADDRGVRLPERRLSLRLVPSPPLAVTTDQQGAFELALPRSGGPVTVSVRFPGGPHHAASDIERVVDPGRASARLQLLFPTEVSLGEDRVELQVRAEQGERPLAIPVAIAVDGRSGELARVATGPSGWGLVAISPRAIGGPGHRLLVARFDGDATLAPALARSEVLVVDPTTLSLHAERPRVRLGEPARLSGALRGALGPLGAEEVSLRARGGLVATTRTRPDGSFRFEVGSRELPTGESTELEATFESAGRSRSGARSAPVAIHVAAPEPLAGWLAALPAAMTLLLVGVVLARARLRGRRSERRRPDGPFEGPASGGLQPDRARGRRSRLPDCFDVAGVLWDPVEDRPVAGARVALEGERAVAVGPDGAFVLAGLAAGAHRFVVEAPGYVPERFALSCPHDGGGARLRVHVVQVRHRALEAYRSVAAGLLPRPGLWGFWTPRELAVHAARERPWVCDQWAELTSRFEEAYYSGCPARLDQLEALRGVVVEIEKARVPEDAGTDDG